MFDAASNNALVDRSATSSIVAGPAHLRLSIAFGAPARIAPSRSPGPPAGGPGRIFCGRDRQAGCTAVSSTGRCARAGGRGVSAHDPAGLHGDGDDQLGGRKRGCAPPDPLPRRCSIGSIPTPAEAASVGGPFYGFPAEPRPGRSKSSGTWRNLTTSSRLRLPTPGASSGAFSSERMKGEEAHWRRAQQPTNWPVDRNGDPAAHRSYRGCAPRSDPERHLRDRAFLATSATDA